MARVPDRGDIVWLSLDPTLGHEQAGRRPVLVLSPALYNGRAGLAVVCPITSRSKGYPFEVALPRDLSVTGVALADHLRSVDWRERRAELACLAPAELVEDILARSRALLS